MAQEKHLDEMSTFSSIGGVGDSGKDGGTVASDAFTFSLEDIEKIVKHHELSLDLQVDDDLRDEEEALSTKSAIESSAIKVAALNTSSAPVSSAVATESQPGSQSNKRGFEDPVPALATSDLITGNTSVSSTINSRQFLPMIGESRQEYLLRVPELMRKAINIGSETMIAAIVNEACLPACLLKTTALKTEVSGRENIVNLYCSLLKVVPDMVILIKPPSQDFRVITSKVNYYGTSVFRDEKNEHLYNYMKYGPDAANKVLSTHLFCFMYPTIQFTDLTLNLVWRC